MSLKGRPCNAWDLHFSSLIDFMHNPIMFLNFLPNLLIFAFAISEWDLALSLNILLWSSSTFGMGSNLFDKMNV